MTAHKEGHSCDCAQYVLWIPGGALQTIVASAVAIRPPGDASTVLEELVADKDRPRVVPELLATMPLGHGIEMWANADQHTFEPRDCNPIAVLWRDGALNRFGDQGPRERKMIYGNVVVTMSTPELGIIGFTAETITVMLARALDCYGMWRAAEERAS